MSQAAADVSTRAWALLALVAGAVLIPTLTGTIPDLPAGVSVALMSLAVAAISRLVPGTGTLACRAPSTVAAAGRDTCPVPAGRVTDPVHHPLRPRAPGMA